MSNSVSEGLSTGGSVILSEQLKLLKGSGLFDEEYYVGQLKGLPSAELSALAEVSGVEEFDAAKHFLQVGSGLGLDPHPLFSTNFYLSQNKFSKPVREPAVIHYLASTAKEAYRPHVLFDTQYYLASSLEVGYLAAKINPLVLFLHLGDRDGASAHVLFDRKYYLEQLSVEADQVDNALLHYLTIGFKNGLNPHALFDCSYYLEQFPSLEAQSIEPLSHYLLKADMSKVRPHPLFLPEYVLSQLPSSAIVQENLLLYFITSPDTRNISPHPYFDSDYYGAKNPDLKTDQVHLFLHYLRHGYAEGRNPNDYFQSRWYLLRNLPLLKIGENSLAHYVRKPTNLRAQAHPFIDANGDFKPLLGSRATEVGGFQFSELDAAYDQLMSLSHGSFTHLFIIPGLVRAGGERAACSFIKYCQARHGLENVLVLMADYFEHSSRHWLPENTRLFDVRNLLPENYKAEDMALLLAVFIASVRPRVTHIINSFSATSALSGYGKYLSEFTKFVFYMFGYESYVDNSFALLKHPIFNSALENADCVITDTKRLSTAIKQYAPGRLKAGKPTRECYLYSEHFREIESKFLPRALSKNKDAQKVLWASRITKSKRPDLLVQIARRLPQVQFVVYGSCELETEEVKAEYLKLLGSADNIEIAGDFSDFGNLDLNSYALFLYTSQGDGVPLVLLEAASAGLPLIAPKVGGIGELLSNENSWLIEPYDDVDGYVRALSEALSCSGLAARKVERLLNDMAGQHSRDYFYEQLGRFAQYF